MVSNRDEIMKSFINGEYDRYTRDVKIAAGKHAFHYKNTSK